MFLRPRFPLRISTFSLSTRLLFPGAAAGDWLYNVLLSYNAVSTIEIMHSAIQYFWFIARPGLMKAFRKFWSKTDELAVVVSFVPMLNAVFAETLPPNVSLFTVLTDFTHTKSHPWIQHPRQHLITGTDVAFAQALKMGYLPPGFYQCVMFCHQNKRNGRSSKLLHCLGTLHASTKIIRNEIEP